MAKKQKKPNEAGGAANGSLPDSKPLAEVRRKVRMITAKDAGWITPTAFVAPVTLVPIDPPRPIKKRRTQ